MQNLVKEYNWSTANLFWEATNTIVKKRQDYPSWMLLSLFYLMRFGNLQLRDDV